MSKNIVSEKIKQFIFEHIDSVELLEVLLLIRAHKNSKWNADQIAQELRSSSKSVSTRLNSLVGIGLLEALPESKGLYQYKSASSEFETILDELNETYKIRRQAIFELIFSPLKKGRHFANAFLVNPSKKDESEDNNG
jgi:predicted transcriptional regulator